MPKTVTIYAGRLNFSFEKTPDDVDKFVADKLFELVSSKAIIEKNAEFIWRFGGVQKQDDSIVGRFGKINKSKISAQFDDKINDFIETSRSQEEAYYSNFCIFVKEHLILFEKRFGVGQRDFKGIFEKAFNNLCHTGELEIELLTDKKEVMKIIEESDKLEQIEFNLRPSNPDSSQDSKLIDDALKAAGSKKGKIILENKETGLNRTKKLTLITSGIALCNLGYGTYKIRASKGGELLFIDSVKKIIKEKAPRPELGKELESFKKILKRIKARLE
jgi:hypothetical protein